MSIELEMLERSINGFNGGKNADRSSASRYYESYLTRKKQVLEAGIHAYYTGKPVNTKNLKKEALLYRTAKKNKPFVINYIEQKGFANPQNYSDIDMIQLSLTF